MSDDDNTVLREEKEIQNVAIRPPAFMETAVNGWFPIMEAQFSLRNVTVSSTKFYHILSALPAEIVSKLPATVITSKSYETIKEAILSMYERTKPEMLDKLMATTSISGRPSIYLQEMSTLADRIGASEDIVRHKFLQALPASISPVLASQKEIPLAQLGKLADELLPYFSDGVVKTISHVQPRDKGNSHSRQRNVYNENGANNSIPFGLRPFNSDQRPRVCRAHLYFADKARQCKPWCRWPNKQNLRILPNSRSASPARSTSSGN